MSSVSSAALFIELNLVFYLSPLSYQQLFNCQLLHRLSMPDNDLTVLPAAIANLINLRELDVSKNSKQHHRSRRRAALPHKRFYSSGFEWDDSWERKKKAA